MPFHDRVIRRLAFVFGLALIGCASTSPGPGGGTTGPRSGFERALDGPIAILPTLTPRFERQLEPPPARLAATMHAELFVAHGDAIRAPEQFPRGIRGLQALVDRFSRGERIVASDTVPVAEVVESPFALLTWVEESTEEGGEAVRRDMEPTDLRADDGLASYVAVDGVLEARLLDLQTAEVLWIGRRTYGTPRDFDGAVDASALSRARSLAATDLARDLEFDWSRSPRPVRESVEGESRPAPD